MRLALACDHAGYVLKESIREFLESQGVDYTDCGTFSVEPVDYPDIGLAVAQGVADGHYDRAILVCGTGIGMCMCANKVSGVRAALCHDAFSARAAREHNDANVLTLGARVIGPGLACEVVRVWLAAQFAGGRHAARVDKITAAERRFAGVPRHRGAGHRD